MLTILTCARKVRQKKKKNRVGIQTNNTDVFLQSTRLHLPCNFVFEIVNKQFSVQDYRQYSLHQDRVKTMCAKKD